MSSCISIQAIECITPYLGDAVPVIVSVTSNGQDYLPSTLFFDARATASVYSITPTSGPVTGGTVVTVTGSNFVNASSGLYCSFGSEVSDIHTRSSTNLKVLIKHLLSPYYYTLQVVPATYISSTSLQCTSPAAQAPRLTLLEVSVYVQQNLASSDGGRDVDTAAAWTNDQVSTHIRD